jgi:hypothetical protein
MDNKALYNIGDLITEIVDGLNLSTGVICEVWYDDVDQQYVYSVMWSDMDINTQILESIMKWRIENEIFGYYKVLFK